MALKTKPRLNVTLKISESDITRLEHAAYRRGYSPFPDPGQSRRRAACWMVEELVRKYLEKGS